MRNNSHTIAALRSAGWLAAARPKSHIRITPRKDPLPMKIKRPDSVWLVVTSDSRENTSFMAYPTAEAAEAAVRMWQINGHNAHKFNFTPAKGEPINGPVGRKRIPRFPQLSVPGL